MTIDFIKKCTANVNTNLSFLQILDEIPTNVSCTQVPFKRFFSEQCLLSVYENSHLRFLQSSLFVSSNNQCIINLGTVWHESFFFLSCSLFSINVIRYVSYIIIYDVEEIRTHLRETRTNSKSKAWENRHKACVQMEKYMYRVMLLILFLQWKEQVGVPQNALERRRKTQSEATPFPESVTLQSGFVSWVFSGCPSRS